MAKYARSGTFRWAISFGGAGNDAANGIAVDGTGNIFVGGGCSGLATFGTTTLTSPGGADAFAAKLDGGGNVLWARNGLTVAGKTLNTSGLGIYVDVAADAAGNVYVADYLKGPLSDPRNAAIFKFDGGTGVTQWTDQLLGTTNKKGEPQGWTHVRPRLTVVGGNVYVAGTFFGTVDMDPGPGSSKLSGGGTFVLKLTTAGSFVWARAFGGNYSPLDTDIAVDSSGNVYATGAGFVAKLNTSGNLEWTKNIGPGGASVAVDAAGAVYLTGRFTGTQDFNPGSGTYNLTSAGGYDAFVRKLDTNGTFQWAIRAGAAGDDSGSGICVDPFGDVYITGTIGIGTADFDPTQSYLDDLDLMTGPSGFLWQIVQP